MVLTHLEGANRAKVQAEIRARENFLLHLDDTVEVTCNCGLVLSRRRFYEHQKVTQHGLKAEAGQKIRDSVELSEQASVHTQESFEVCSCGLMIPASGMGDHMKEAHGKGHAKSTGPDKGEAPVAKRPPKSLERTPRKGPRARKKTA